MRAALLVNPIAGRGRALTLAESAADGLIARGIAADIFRHPPDAHQDLSGYAAAAVIGGDGTLNRWLAPLTRSSTPVWHMPMGTENLFARSFGHRGSVHRFLQSLETGRTLAVDVGRCGARLFAIMISVGPDADVVRAVAARRDGPISRLDYLPPILSRLIRPLTTSARIRTESGAVHDGPVGMVVVANLPAYATRLNPAWEAVPDDGELDLVHLPGKGAVGVGLRLMACLGRDSELVPDRTRATGRTICIRSPDRPAVQIDGDLLDAEAWTDDHRLEIEVMPRALHVLAADH